MKQSTRQKFYMRPAVASGVAKYCLPLPKILEDVKVLLDLADAQRFSKRDLHLGLDFFAYYASGRHRQEFVLMKALCWWGFVLRTDCRAGVFRQGLSISSSLDFYLDAREFKTRAEVLQEMRNAFFSKLYTPGIHIVDRTQEQKALIQQHPGKKVQNLPLDGQEEQISGVGR